MALYHNEPTSMPAIGVGFYVLNLTPQIFNARHSR